MNSCNRNWLNSINGQLDFYQRANRKPRTDSEFPWQILKEPPSVRRLVKWTMHKLGLRRPRPSLGWLTSSEWLDRNAEPLWESRSLLNDELSKVLFDATLVVRLAGYKRFYYPRIIFNDLFEIEKEIPFHNSDLPGDYIGLPLKQFEIRLKEHPNTAPITVVSCEENLMLLNNHHQYFMRRNGIDFSPEPGEIVLDCGACIGDYSLIFAGYVAMKGEIHLFDPIPLHSKFCRLQASLNPSLAHIFHINELAVNNHTQVTSGDKSDSHKIEPAGLAIDSFASTSLDDYAEKAKLGRIDYIKMDIEGAEMDAIEGAEEIIREFKPRLAISAYHKPYHLWEIPIKLKSLNPGYELYFGHHSPLQFESVFYTVQR